MNRLIIQVYEIQDPHEAESVIALGADHVGSVILSEGEWKVPAVKEVVGAARQCGAKGGIIPLFNTPDAVFRVLEYYNPDIVHFCEMLPPGESGRRERERLIRLQYSVRERFPGVAVMRSIPIPAAASGHVFPVVEVARDFEAVSDFFLTDTLISNHAGASLEDQPVAGFVGITGITCDWDAAAELVRESRIPVILAGGLSPENVAEGVVKVCPAGVDTCTATNALDDLGRPVRFRKDLEKVRRFVEEARGAAE